MKKKLFTIMIMAAMIALLISCIGIAESESSAQITLAQPGDTRSTVDTAPDVTLHATALGVKVISVEMQLYRYCEGDAGITACSREQLADTLPEGYTENEDGSISTVLTGRNHDLHLTGASLSVFREESDSDREYRYFWAPVRVTVDGVTASYDPEQWSYQADSKKYIYDELVIRNGESTACMTDGAPVIFSTAFDSDDCKISLTGNTSVEIVWDCRDSEGNSRLNPESGFNTEGLYCEFRVLQNGTEYGNHLYLNANDAVSDYTWHRLLSDLPKYDNRGAEYRYTVECVRVFDPTGGTNDYTNSKSYTIGVRDGMSVTAASFVYAPSLVQLHFEISLDWMDGNVNADRKPAQFTVYRFQDEDCNLLETPEQVAQVVLNAENGWYRSVDLDLASDYDVNNNYVVLETGLQVNGTMLPIVIDPNSEDHTPIPAGDISTDLLYNLQGLYFAPIISSTPSGIIGSAAAVGDDWDGLSCTYSVSGKLSSSRLFEQTYSFRNTRTGTANVQCGISCEAESYPDSIGFTLVQNGREYGRITLVTDATPSIRTEGSIETACFDQTSGTLTVGGLPQYDASGVLYTYDLNLRSIDNEALPNPSGSLNLVSTETAGWRVRRGTKSVTYSEPEYHSVGSYVETYEISRTYKLDNTVLTIYEECCMDSLSECGPWGNAITSVTFADGITQIGAYAFSGCTALTEITVPANVTTIGKDAFQSCSNLTKVTFAAESQLTSIGSNAFDSNAKFYCADPSDSLKTALGAGNIIVKYGDCSRDYDDNVNYVLTADGKLTITGVGKMKDFFDNAPSPWYSDRESITSIEIGSGVTRIANNAFDGCNNEKLTTIGIPDSVTEIGAYAFRSCTGLTSFTIPSGVQSIDTDAFSECRNLKMIYYPGGEADGFDEGILVLIDYGIIGVEGAEGVSFFGRYELDIKGELNLLETGGDMTDYSADEPAPWSTYKNRVRRANIGWMNNIGAYAFYGYSNLEGIDLPGGIESIGEYAFASTALNSVSIPNEVSSIGSHAFADTALTEITIPGSVTSIGDYALGYKSETEKVENFTITGKIASAAMKYAKDNGFNFTANDDISAMDTLTLPSDLKRVEESAFLGTAAELIVIPSGCEYVASDAFDGCTNLKVIVNHSEAEVTVPWNVYVIEE